MTRRTIVLVAVLLAGIGIASVGIWGQRRAEGPQQPIEFSHRLHAGENQIPCLYCHPGAARAAQAGVPAVAICQGCHRLVKLKTSEIEKLLQHWENAEPIRWVRVHSLPDHVYFSHKRHSRAGISCETCHGELRAADRVSQFAPLTMGWCVDCHRERSASLECSACHQ